MLGTTQAYYSCVGGPIRLSPDRRLRASPRGLSQLAPSTRWFLPRACDLSSLGLPRHFDSSGGRLRSSTLQEASSRIRPFRFSGRSRHCWTSLYLLAFQLLLPPLSDEQPHSHHLSAFRLPRQGTQEQQRAQEKAHPSQAKPALLAKSSCSESRNPFVAWFPFPDVGEEKTAL